MSTALTGYITLMERLQKLDWTWNLIFIFSNVFFFKVLLLIDSVLDRMIFLKYSESNFWAIFWLFFLAIFWLFFVNFFVNFWLEFDSQAIIVSVTFRLPGLGETVCIKETLFEDKASDFEIFFNSKIDHK